MRDSISPSITGALASASTGAVLQGQLFPVSNSGALRITYNWLYSALNCNPADSSEFLWTLNKVDDNGTISLSPSQGYQGMTLYASVRPDWSYFVQVQAPNSANWITAVGGDERMTMTELGLMTITMTGLNGQLLAVNSSPTSWQSHSGYKLQSNGGTVASPSTSFFVAVSQILQPAVILPRAVDLPIAGIVAALAAAGSPDPAPLARQIAFTR